MSTGTSGIGQSVSRVDARPKVTGVAQFTGDLVIPGMLQGKVLRSPLAHARITHLDTSAAEALPGVVAVMTGKDIAGDGFYGHAVKDRPIVAVDRVRFAGEPVAAVAAVDEATALEALDLIQVDYEPLPLVDTMEKALAADAPRLHEVEGLELGLFHGLGGFRPFDNVCYYHKIRKDEERLDTVFAQADIVVEGEYTFPAIYQYSMEPHATVARWEPDGITVWSNCQHPYLVRAELADVFGFTPAEVRVVVSYLGGGFGSKSYTKMEPLAVALARQAGRPVRIANRVDESMVTSRRHNMTCKMRTAATADGELLARDVQMWLDTGAYADNGPRVVATAADAAPGPYRWGPVRVDAWGVYTNRPPSGSYRAFGATHMQWIGESQVDEVARRAGVDRVAIRERNLLRPGEQVRPGGKPLDADLVGDIQKVAQALGWDEPAPPGVGRGLGVGLLAAGAHPVSSAIVRLEADGTATLLVSSTEMGQGTRTALGQLVCQELALPIDRIRVPGGDTQLTPYDRSTGASRSTTLAGTAVHRAALDVRGQLQTIAAGLWDTAPASVDLRDGSVCFQDETMTYPELLKAYFGLAGGEIIGQGRVQPELGKGTYAAGPYFWEVCVGGAEVEVDTDTGRIHVRRLVSVADVGQAVNPHLVEAQEMGGAMQGLGNAVFEEMIFSDGQLLNATLLDYHVPTIEDLPDAFTSTLAENEDGPGPYGIKGVGEGALAAVPAAIANALADLGLHMTEMPFTPERVWRALQESGGEDH